MGKDSGNIARVWVMTDLIGTFSWYWGATDFIKGTEYHSSLFSSSLSPEPSSEPMRVRKGMSEGCDLRRPIFYAVCRHRGAYFQASLFPGAIISLI